MQTPLPIDHVLPMLLEAVRADGRAVLVAPPGAGKTTRVPPALLPLIPRGEIVVLEPRRLAARLAACRVAEELGEPVGETVGYQVRFDRKVGAKTRIRFVTEELFVQQFLTDPDIRDVGAVVIDEFHERHIAGDVVLSLVHALRAQRPELVFVVMSATIDPGPVASFLECRAVRSPGRQFEVTTEYASDPKDRPLAQRVASAVRGLAKELGDVLVFLPGVAEIHRCLDALATRSDGREVVMIHGSLNAREQDRALAATGPAKVILATNVAETSITVPRVTAVIDSGLARVARHDPWTGLSTLRLEAISQASADQRRGRAGRIQPGRCVRLYGEHDYRTRRPYDSPEILRGDLSSMVFSLIAAGILSPESLAWLDSPPAQAVATALDLLQKIGAVDEARTLTEVGREMVQFPAHPRQARIIVEGRRRGVGREACLLAAVIGERGVRKAKDRGAVSLAVSDVLDTCERVRAAADRGRIEARDAKRYEIDLRGAHAVLQVAKQFEQRLSPRAIAPAADPEDCEQRLLIATMAGFPDRIARRRRANENVYLLAGGGSARLADTSVVRDAEFLVAMDASERASGARRDTVIYRASQVESDWILELFLDQVEEVDTLGWDPQQDRVERMQQLRYGNLLLEESRRPATSEDGARVGQLLAEAALAKGIEHFIDSDALANWRLRVAFAAPV